MCLCNPTNFTLHQRTDMHLRFCRMHIYGNPLLRNAEVTCLVICSGTCLFVVLASQQCCMGWPNKSDKEVMPEHTGLKRFQRVSNCQSFSAPWSERDEPNHFTQSLDWIVGQCGICLVKINNLNLSVTVTFSQPNTWISLV